MIFDRLSITVRLSLNHSHLRMAQMKAKLWCAGLDEVTAAKGRQDFDTGRAWDPRNHGQTKSASLVPTSSRNIKKMV